MKPNIAHVSPEYCYPRFKTALGGRAAVLQTAPSFMPNAEINRAKLTAYVSCPFVVLLLVVIAFFS